MPRALTVTAIIATYNEEDVIGAVLTDLLDQGVRVHLLDQSSSDGTVAEAKRLGRRGRLTIERMEADDFALARIIRRKEVLAAELDTDWVINADADEFRESPWPGVGFVQGIEEVDRLGYNAIDFAVLNFLPVNDDFRKGQDPREVFHFYERGAIYDRLQVRCWKKQPGRLDLVSTAGHEASFPGRRVFPLRFLLRHYPIRGQAHGERKVLKERLPRFTAEERARGWHVQYDGVKEGASFLREPSSLTPYDPWSARVEVVLRNRDVDGLESALAENQRELAASREQLAGSRAELAGSRAELAASHQELGLVRADLLGSRETLAATRELQAGLGRELTLAHAAFQFLQQQAEGIRSERDGLLQSQSDLRGERDRLRQSQEDLRKEHDDLRLEGERLEGALRQGHQEVSMLRQELAAMATASERRAGVLQHRLDAMLASRIWRWSAPLRALLDTLSRSGA
jgi:hypothetical protein